MRQKLLIFLIVVFLIAFISYLWWVQAVKAMNPIDNKQITFNIKRGETVRSIAERLYEEKIIRSSVAFFLLARFGDLSNKIQSGDFRLQPSMDTYTIANSLTHGTTDIWFTIPEGWRNEEIAQVLSKNFDIPEGEFLKYAKEGYMFPDTYLVPKESTSEKLSQIFYDNLNKKITKEIIDKAAKNNINLRSLIIIASLVEREAKNDIDRPLVASVILNRLKLGMKLDIDATVQYILGYQSSEKSWWKKNLTSEDLTTESPFNTYLNSGLPPAPISNPGLAVIKAVTDAPDTEYLYYLSDKNGKTYFAKNFDEHNLNITKHLNN